MVTRLIILALLAWCPAAPAAVWLDINGLSLHSPGYWVDQREAHHRYNEINPGLGITYARHNWRFMAGEYLNSYRKPSIYAAVGWLPLHLFGVRFGPVVGEITGYDNTPANGAPLEPLVVFETEVPVTSYVRLNVGVLPDFANVKPASAVLFQAGIKIW